MKKRFLSMLLAIVMVVGMLPGFTLTASAVEEKVVATFKYNADSTATEYTNLSDALKALNNAESGKYVTFTLMDNVNWTEDSNMRIESAASNITFQLNTYTLDLGSHSLETSGSSAISLAGSGKITSSASETVIAGTSGETSLINSVCIENTNADGFAVRADQKVVPHGATLIAEKAMIAYNGGATNVQFALGSAYSFCNTTASAVNASTICTETWAKGFAFYADQDAATGITNCDADGVFWAIKPCEHNNVNETNGVYTCGDCSTQMLVKVSDTNGSNVKYYTTLSARDWSTRPVLTLLDDLSISNTGIGINDPEAQFIFDTNGKTVNGNLTFNHMKVIIQGGGTFNGDIAVSQGATVILQEGITIIGQKNDFIDDISQLHFLTNGCFDLTQAPGTYNVYTPMNEINVADSLILPAGYRVVDATGTPIETIAAGSFGYIQPIPASHTVTVTNGEGGGTYEVGATVTIKANTPETGKKFTGWTSEDGVVFADSKSAETTFIMPDKSVTVTATYADLLPGKVIVNGVDLVNGEDDHAIDCGEGTAVYDPATQTLTLTDAEITIPSPGGRKAGVYFDAFTGTDTVTINIVGENSIKLTDSSNDNNGIWNDSSADLKITGTGSLDVLTYNDYSPFGIWNQKGDLSIENAELTFSLASGSASNGFLVDTNAITLDGVKLTASGYLQGLFSLDSLTIENHTEVDITSIENALHSEGVITIEGSTVEAETTDYAAICGWNNITIENSTVIAHSDWDSAIYSFGLLTISGGKVEATTNEADALNAFGGITIKDNAEVTAEGAGAGVYTGGVLTVESGKLTAKGGNWAILARKLSNSAENSSPTESAEAITLGTNIVELSGATVKTDDWTYTEVWDDGEYDWVDRWMSRSYFVDGNGNIIIEANIVSGYNVEYRAGVNGTGDNTSAIKIPGTPLTLKDAIYTRIGYTQIGWATTDGGEKIYDLGAEYTAETNAVLYPFWTANQYTITFDTNGGEAISPITVTYGEKYGRLPSSAVNGLSGGNSNWYLVDENGVVTDTRITNLSEVTTARDHMLKVVRKVLAPTLKITLEVPGGISDGYQYYIPGNSTRILTVTVNNRNDEVLDYTYQWYKDDTAITGATEAVLTLDGNVSDSGTYKVVVTAMLKDGSEIIVTSDSASAEKAQNVKILHAANTLSYDANGGENAPGSHYSGGTSITISADKPNRKGYTFADWNTESDSSGDSYDTGSTYTFANDNGNGGCEVTLYAQWTAHTYTVKFDANGGTGSMADMSFTYGESQNLTANAFTKTNMHFNGWNTVANGSGTAYTNEQSVGNLIAENNGVVTLYAQWSDKSAQTITLDTSDRNATYGDGTLAAREIAASGAITYSSSDETVATVDENGVITVLKAGETIITATAAETAEYASGSVSYKLIVAPKTLTITADSHEVYVGSRQPELTYTVDGLVGNDDLTTAPILSTDANMYRAGTYAITFASEAAAGDNYAITYVNGTLTVKNYPYIPIIPSNPTYPPVVDGGDNGDVVVTPKNPEKGDIVTITPDPDAGYEVDEIIVADRNGNPVTVVDNGDGTYSFKQPSGKVNIEVTFKEIVKVCPGDKTCPMYGYTDLDMTAWYHDGVHFCIAHGLMQGVGNNEFAPGGTTTRAMIVTILWRLEGSPVANYAMDFEDVAADQWYYDAIRWAASEKIVEGYGDTFGPNDSITREQIATIMFRYAKYKGYDVSVHENTNILSYDDAFEVAEWAIPAMQWACGESLIQGIADGNTMNLAPQGNATRAQAATILQRFVEHVAKED